MIVSKEFARQSSEKSSHIWVDFPDIVSSYTTNLAARNCSIPDKDYEEALTTIRKESRRIAEILIECARQKNS
jgi:hypothetical protein